MSSKFYSHDFIGLHTDCSISFNSWGFNWISKIQCENKFYPKFIPILSHRLQKDYAPCTPIRITDKYTYIIRISRYRSQSLPQMHPGSGNTLSVRLIFWWCMILAQSNQNVRHRRQNQFANLQDHQIRRSPRNGVGARHKIIFREHLQKRMGLSGHHKIMLKLVRLIRKRIYRGHQHSIKNFQIVEHLKVSRHVKTKHLAARISSYLCRRCAKE